MEIDAFSLIVGTIFFIVIFGTLGFLTWSGQNRVRKMRKALNEMGIFYQLHFRETDVWNDKALGLDATQKILVFINHTQGEKRRQLVKLSKARMSRIVQTPTLIQVIIEVQDRKRVLDELVTIFDSNTDDRVEFGFHMTLAKKWEKLIKGVITTQTLRPSKAA